MKVDRRFYERHGVKVDRRFHAPRALAKLLAEWQRRLGLQAFVIRLEVVRASAFGDHNTIGDCDALHMKRKAKIRLLDPCDYGEYDGSDDHETTLVHELLHLVLPMHVFGLRTDEDDLHYRLYEQAIDQLARTLVALKRAK